MITWSFNSREMSLTENSMSPITELAVFFQPDSPDEGVGISTITPGSEREQHDFHLTFEEWCRLRDWIDMKFKEGSG